mgnify:CR=1 FL=1
MAQTAKDILGVGILVAATALFIGVHSWFVIM